MGTDEKVVHSEPFPTLHFPPDSRVELQKEKDRITQTLIGHTEQVTGGTFDPNLHLYLPCIH